VLVKWLGREGDHSPACSAEVKNAWDIPLYSLEFLHGVVFHYAGYKFTKPLGILNC
jgi:hypothetical protein